MLKVLCCQSAPDSHCLCLAHETWHYGAGVSIFGACGGAGETKTHKSYLHEQEEACAQVPAQYARDGAYALRGQWHGLCAHLRSEQRSLLQSSLEQMSTLLGRLCAHWKSELLPRAGYCPTLNDSAYTWGQGTSFATPHVAGVAAM